MDSISHKLSGSGPNPISVAEVKARTTLSEVCNALGIHWDKRTKKLRCVAHPDNTPSATIYREHLKCFDCGFSGDVFDVVGARLGLTFKESLQWVADFCRTSIATKTLTGPEKRKFVCAKRAASAEAKLLVEWRREIIDTLRHERNSIWELEQLASK
jgi:DNA primase